MPALETRTCVRCGATADQVQLGQLISEPQGWTYATVGGLPVCNVKLCPSCARDVREVLATPPARSSGRHAANEISAEAADAIADLVLADAQLRGDA